MLNEVTHTLSSTTSAMRTEPAGIAPLPRNIVDDNIRQSSIRLLRTHQFEDVLALFDKYQGLIHVTDDEGADAVRYAIVADNASVVERLAIRGAYLNSKDPQGWTPIMEAAHLGFSKVLKVLISHGADMNAKTPLGWTPVQLALMQGHSEAAIFLIHAGAELRDGPMPGLYAIDLLDNMALDLEVVRLAREKAGLPEEPCCGRCQGDEATICRQDSRGGDRPTVVKKSIQPVKTRV